MKIKNNNETRNPSPPPLTEAERQSISGDLIGSTIFSQHWVLDTLLKLYKHEESTVYTTSNKDIEEDEKTPEHTTLLSTDQTECSSNKKRSLESGFENDLCQLWDMTANTEVAHFLNENDIKSVLRDALKRTRSPRLMEICFGILGNMLCVKEIRISYTAVAAAENMDCGEFRAELLSYLTVIDALSLVELTRLLCTCVSCSSCSSLWVRDLLGNMNHVGQLTYLLKNTLNVDLLSHVVKILDVLFDEMNSEQFNDHFVTVDLVTGLIEAYDQFNDNGTKSEYFVSLIHLLQLVATESNKCAELVTKDSDVIFKFFEKYFKILDSDEGRSDFQVFERLTIYASILSLLVTMSVELKGNIIKFMMKNIDFMEQCLDYLRNIVENGHSGISVYLSICMEALSPLLNQLFAFNSTNGIEQSDLATLQIRIDDLLKTIGQSTLYESLDEMCASIENCKKL